jgi:hypothetical protein
MLPHIMRKTPRPPPQPACFICIDATPTIKTINKVNRVNPSSYFI